jgi:hypothetical protein
VKELLSNVGSGGGAPAVGAPAAASGNAGTTEEAPKEEAKEEAKEESDDDMVRTFGFNKQDSILILRYRVSDCSIRQIPFSWPVSLLHSCFHLAFAYMYPNAVATDNINLFAGTQQQRVTSATCPKRSCPGDRI